MKRYKFIAATAAVLAFASSSFADVTLRFTGSSAFRAAAHAAMRDMLTYAAGGSGATTQGVGYTGSSLSGATNSIFRGTIAGSPALGVVTIKCTWSGSTGGIQTLTSGATVAFLDSATALSGNATGSSVTATLTDVSRADCTMMDSQQTTTPYQSPELTSEVVGVLPFVFVASQSAPAGLTNMTAQLSRQLLSSGFLSASAWTGNNADAPLDSAGATNASGTTVYAAGRDNSSGTRTITLSETGVGASSRVLQVYTTVPIRVTGAQGATVLTVNAADRPTLSSSMKTQTITLAGTITGGATVSNVNATTITIPAPGLLIAAADATVTIGPALSTGTATALFKTLDGGNGGQSSGGTLADQLRVDTSGLLNDPFNNQVNQGYSPRGCMIGYLGLSDADRAVNGTGSGVGSGVRAKYLAYEGFKCTGGVPASLTIGSQGAGATTLTVTSGSTTGIIAGQLVSGAGIAPGTTVVSTTGSTITLSVGTSNSTTLTNNVIKATEFLPATVRNGSYSLWTYERLGYLPFTDNTPVGSGTAADKTSVKTKFFQQVTGSSTDLGSVGGIPDDNDMRFTRSLDGGQISSKF